MSGRAVVDVAVGVLIRPDGCFLLASRPAGKPYAGYWEFPGGKLEPGEAVAHALSRELHEELGIDIGPVTPWLVREFEYPHAHVRLHFCRVFRWTGMPHAREGQQLQFASLTDLPDGPLLPATAPVLRWLVLPAVCGVTNAAELGAEAFLARLDRALERGLQLVIFREPRLDAEPARALFEATLAKTRSAGSRLLVSSRHPAEWATAADGVHLTARDLMALSRRPTLPWVSASVHDEVSLAHAAALGADFAVLGPVNATHSHPEAEALGWSRFGQRVAATSIPVYAIGGLNPSHLRRAQVSGAHGIAAQRAIWSNDYSFEDGSGDTGPAMPSGAPVGIE